jgi:predicted ribosomally synthesized peptide with nif11-like leader
MSTDQLSALVAKLKDDKNLREKLLSIADFDAALTLVQEAGFEVRKADLLRYQANQVLNLSDDQLERMKGSIAAFTNPWTCCDDTGCTC